MSSSQRRCIAVCVFINVTTIIFHTVCSRTGKISPSPVETSTRPKSTKLHALPLHVINYSLLLESTLSKLAIKLPACSDLQQDFCCLILTSDFLFRMSYMLNVNDSRADWLRGDGMNIFRPSIPNISCHPFEARCFFFFSGAVLATKAIASKVLYRVRQFNILKFICVAM